MQGLWPCLVAAFVYLRAVRTAQRPFRSARLSGGLRSDSTGYLSMKTHRSYARSMAMSSCGICLLKSSAYGSKTFLTLGYVSITEVISYVQELATKASTQMR